MPKSLIICQLNEILNSKVPSSSLLRLQKTASSLDSRFADHPHTQIVPPLRNSKALIRTYPQSDPRKQVTQRTSRGISRLHYKIYSSSTILLAYLGLGETPCLRHLQFYLCDHVLDVCSYHVASPLTKHLRHVHYWIVWEWRVGRYLHSVSTRAITVSSSTNSSGASVYHECNTLPVSSPVNVCTISHYSNVTMTGLQLHQCICELLSHIDTVDAAL